MTANLPMVDTRTRLRLWNKNWECLIEERFNTGDEISAAIQRMLLAHDLKTAMATIEWSAGGRWSGVVSLKTAQP